MLASGATHDEIVKWVQDAVLGSYQNGLAARQPDSKRREAAARKGRQAPAPKVARPRASAPTAPAPVNEDSCIKCGKSGTFPDSLCDTCYSERG